MSHGKYLPGGTCVESSIPSCPVLKPSSTKHSFWKITYEELTHISDSGACEKVTSI